MAPSWRHGLETIKGRGQEELKALLLTRNVEQAKAGVAELESQLRDLDAEIGRLRPAEGAPGAEGPAEGTGRLGDLQARHAQIDAEIRRLRETISAASDEAARAVSERAGGSSRHVA